MKPRATGLLRALGALPGLPLLTGPRAACRQERHTVESKVGGHLGLERCCIDSHPPTRSHGDHNRGVCVGKNSRVGVRVGLERGHRGQAQSWAALNLCPGLRAWSHHHPTYGVTGRVAVCKGWGAYRRVILRLEGFSSPLFRQGNCILRANAWPMIMRQVRFTEPWSAPDACHFLTLSQPRDAWEMSDPLREPGKRRI